jgi:hypothetical protein
LGGTTWGRAGADGGGAAPHNACPFFRGKITQQLMSKVTLYRLLAIFVGAFFLDEASTLTWTGVLLHALEAQYHHGEDHRSHYQNHR